MKSAKPRIEILESRVVPSTFTVTTLADAGAGSLRDALAKADTSPGPDTIKFKLPAPPAHGENVILLTSGEFMSRGNVTIMGPGSGKLIIDGNNASRVFAIDDGNPATDSPTTISGLSIIRGNASSFGGGVYSSESLSLNDVVVSQCTTTGNGGGVAVNGSGLANQKVQISNSLITGNSGSGFGGGLDVIHVGAITLQRTIVTGNTASSGPAGGVYLAIVPAGTGISVSGCQINDNSASSGGGMELVNNSTLAKAKTTISDTTISGNASTSNGTLGGGGVLVEKGQTVISGSTIENNTAVNDGGGVDATGFSSLTITKTAISGNQTTAMNAANQGGGGIFVSGSGSATPVDISSSTIDNNRSASDGGGLLALGGIALTITGTTFAGNQSVNNGGGIMTTGTVANKVDIAVTGSTFANNFSNGSGGGLYASGDGRISISSSIVTGNVAIHAAGGIFATSTAATNGVMLNDLTVSGNFANGGGGGGVLISSTTDFHVTGGTFSDNNGVEAGGGIAVINSGGSIRGATITGNVSTVGGGVWQGGGTVTLQVAMVHGNTAPVDPDVHGTFTFV
jgi:predicted outer membrane repeat protein